MSYNNFNNNNNVNSKYSYRQNFSSQKHKFNRYNQSKFPQSSKFNHTNNFIQKKPINCNALHTKSNASYQKELSKIDKKINGQSEEVSLIGKLKTTEFHKSNVSECDTTLDWRNKENNKSFSQNVNTHAKYRINATSLVSRSHQKNSTKPLTGSIEQKSQAVITLKSSKKKKNF